MRTGKFGSMTQRGAGWTGCRASGIRRGLGLCVILWWQAGCALGADAQAQPSAEPGRLFDLSMEALMDLNVVSSASFFPVKREESPVFCQTFSKQELAVSPVRTLGELIELKCPSFATGGSPREGLQIGGRGITSENSWRTLLLIDGHNVNHRVHFGMLEAVSTPVLGDIRRIEVITGPGAIVHGSGAFDGFINVTPKNGTEDAGLTTDFEYGFKDDFQKVEAGYGAAYGRGRDIYLHLAHFTADGFEPDDAWDYEHSDANRAWASQLADFDTKAMIRTARPFRFVGDNYRLATYWNHEPLTTHVIFGRTDQDMFSFNEQGYVHSQYLLFQAKCLQALEHDDSLEYIVAGEMFDEYYEWSANTLPAFRLGAKSGGDELGVDGKLIYRTEAIDRHRLACGGVAGHRDTDSVKQFFRKNDLVGPGNDASGEYIPVGLFLEDLIALAPRWSGYAGVRYDRVFQGTYQTHNTVGNVSPLPFRPADLAHWSPQAGLVYDVGKNDTIKTSYRKGFRFPEPAMYGWHDLFGTVLERGGYSRLPVFKPETLDSMELNYISRFPEQRLTLSFSLFHNTYHDRLSWVWFQQDDGYVDPAGWGYVVDNVGWVGSYVNIRGREYIYGGESVASFSATDDLHLNVGYEALEIDNLDVVRYPEQQIKTNLRREFLADRLVADLYYIAHPGGIENAPGVQHPIYDHTRTFFDAALGYRVRENISVKLVGKNVFENDVPPPTFNMDSPQSGHVGRDERRVYLSLQARF